MFERGSWAPPSKETRQTRRLQHTFFTEKGILTIGDRTFSEGLMLGIWTFGSAFEPRNTRDDVEFFNDGGGEILHIEATRYPGKGNITLTGHIGEVMKESVQAALSLLRSRDGQLGVKSEDFRKMDLHVHVPAGAVPKDGPSAGIAMFTALASLFSSRPVRPDVAMTGEITLRGLVLPIGGLKEKSLAAMRAGISTVIIPKLNEKDLVDVPEEVKQKIKFVPVENVDEVLAVALEKDGAGSSESKAA